MSRAVDCTSMWHQLDEMVSIAQECKCSSPHTSCECSMTEAPGKSAQGGCLCCRRMAARFGASVVPCSPAELDCGTHADVMPVLHSSDSDAMLRAGSPYTPARWRGRRDGHASMREAAHDRGRLRVLKVLDPTFTMQVTIQSFPSFSTTPTNRQDTAKFDWQQL